MALISLAEYAEKNNLSPVSVRQKAARGGYKTAYKIGKNWVIDSEEEHIDNRIKTGKYKDWRQPKK